MQINESIEVLVVRSESEKNEHFNSDKPHLGAFVERLYAGEDYDLLPQQGLIFFRKKMKNSSIIIRYYKNIAGEQVYCGDSRLGIKGILNEHNCNLTETPELFVHYEILIINLARD